MSDAKYGEPWEVSPLSGRIVDSGKELLSSWENRRACACVNACQGIPSPAAIPAVIEAARELVNIEHAQDIGVAFGQLAAALAALEGK